MKDQHTKIKGYRDLSQAEIDLMNEIKEMGENLKMLVTKLSTSSEKSPFKEKEYPDQGWVAIGETHLQQGLMALVRSVAKPTTF